jgi:SAM-dependent methyltransferase
MSCEYEGSELVVFAHAQNWKTYWRSRIRPYIRGTVLEVGAGIGSNTLVLRNLTPAPWTCVEPDAGLVEQLARRVNEAGLLHVQYLTGTAATVPDGQTFNTVLYVDVLEHIKDDSFEMKTATRLTSPGGHIVVISPAHQWLFSPFDAAIGHYRRYDRRALLACAPPGCELTRFEYLDSFGLLLSLGNRILLKQSAPSVSQILFWDHRIVPGSRVLDKILTYRFGKTALSVWRKKGLDT